MKRKKTFFRKSDFGRLKVEAIRLLSREYSRFHFCFSYFADSIVSKIIFGGEIKSSRRRIFPFYVVPSNLHFASAFSLCLNIKFHGFAFEEERKLKCENWFDKFEDFPCVTEQVVLQLFSVLIGMKFYWQKWSAKCYVSWFTVSSFLTFLFRFSLSLSMFSFFFILRF